MRAELLMGQRFHTHLDLLHPDISCRVIEKQDKMAAVTRHCQNFAVGDRLYARNFRGSNKWIPVTVIYIIGPISYQVQTYSGTIQRHHVQYHYSLDYTLRNS